MYTGKGREGTLNKKTTTRTMTTGWVQAAACGGGGEHKVVGFLPGWGGGWGGRDYVFCFEAETNHRNNHWGESLLRLDAVGGGVKIMHARKGREGSFYVDTNNIFLVFTSF